MKKYFAFALAFLLAASLLTACGNVSEHPGGRITAPTETSRPVDPVPTMTFPPTEHPDTGKSTDPTRMPDSTDSTMMPDMTIPMPTESVTAGDAAQ